MYEMLAIFGYHSWERSAASLIYSDLLNLLSSASSTSQEIRNSELVVVFLSIKWLYIITVTHIYTSKKEIFKRKLWFGVVVIEMLLEWWLSYQKTEYMFKRNICVHFDNNDNCSNLHKVGFCFDLQILYVCATGIVEKDFIHVWMICFCYLSCYKILPGFFLIKH